MAIPPILFAFRTLVFVSKLSKNFRSLFVLPVLLCDLLYCAWVGNFSSLVLSVYYSSLLKLSQMPPRRAPNNNNNDNNNNDQNICWVVRAQNMSKGKYDWKIIGHEFSKTDVKDMVDPLIKQRTFSYFETFWLCKGNCDKFNLLLEDEHFYIWMQTVGEGLDFSRVCMVRILTVLL
jgi:hypothetical protein